MTSISSSGFGVAPSPFGRVQNALKRDVDAGTISATDGTALASAISDIGSQLQAGATTPPAATGASSTTSPAAPTSMKDRVDSAIDNEMSSGKLTSDQATELKQVFAQAHAHMHGVHGHHGGGAIAALTASSSANTDPVTSTASATATTTGPVAAVETAATNAVTALEAFLTQFKSAVSSTGTYGAAGSNNNSPASLLINAIG